ncbi:protein phosphatases pp1 regulatory subunit,putative [Schistosoma mansoni]|uniref:protein phosphatases pp1 regulatory subunit,putative n=1 Tax=Schistosoma mansoni TaxID=6183 RepID=UPI0001A625E1|nr:protein phosphatases pp1 regulatory subunit,putative [Schistosoma mansoni]|eukprot:XP_018646012.1 protein phosphatases pp1 regulatory subunit,putative [Schistosoma mansoni]
MSTLTEENHCLKNLRNSPNNQSFHFSEGNLSNSNDLIHLLNQIQWKNLTSLNLSSNKLRDITLLNYADKLECLDLSNNFLNNITSIISCKSLISLDISKNNIHELPELNRLPFLEKLNVSHNPLGNISGLWGCMNLRYLDMTSCHLNSYLLIGLNKNEIQLGAINPLEGSNNNLSIYTKETNRFIKNYPTLLGIPQLRFLNLSSNPKLSNVFNIQLNSNECCYGILPYKIEYLNLQGCNISFINGLTFMKRLNILNLSQNQIIDHQGLITLPNIDTPYPILAIIGPVGYQYGLSWEILESIARRGLAGIVVGELELLYGLRLAGLKPRSILCLPNNLHHYERVIRVSISQIHCTQSGLSCDDNILETSLENTEKWINWYIQRTDQLYPQIHRDNPGLFDAVLSSDDTQELFQQLLLLILDYLGISSSNDLSNMQMNDNGITEIRSAP